MLVMIQKKAEGVGMGEIMFGPHKHGYEHDHGGGLKKHDHQDGYMEYTLMQLSNEEYPSHVHEKEHNHKDGSPMDDYNKSSLGSH